MGRLLLECPHPLRQVVDMDVPALWSEIIEGGIETEQVVLVQTAGPLAAKDVLGQLLWVLGPDKLLVAWGSDVDQCSDRRGAIGRLERRVMDGVAVDFSDVKVLLDLCDLFRYDAVGNSPDLVWSGVMMINQLLPVGPLDQCHHAARGFGGSTMVLAYIPGSASGQMAEGTVPSSYLACSGVSDRT